MRRPWHTGCCNNTEQKISAEREHKPWAPLPTEQKRSTHEHNLRHRFAYRPTDSFIHSLISRYIYRLCSQLTWIVHSAWFSLELHSLSSRLRNSLIFIIYCLKSHLILSRLRLCRRISMRLIHRYVCCMYKCYMYQKSNPLWLQVVNVRLRWSAMDLSQYAVFPSLSLRPFSYAQTVPSDLSPHTYIIPAHNPSVEL